MEVLRETCGDHQCFVLTTIALAENEVRKQIFFLVIQLGFRHRVYKPMQEKDSIIPQMIFLIIYFDLKMKALFFAGIIALSLFQQGHQGI